MIIKNIFDGDFDSEVHSDFLKFSRGEFTERYLTEGKRQKDKWVIKTSAEFANYLVKKCLDKVGEKFDVKGIIVATFDLRNECDLDFKKVGNFQGIRKHELGCEISKEKILEVMEKFPRCFFALSFKGEDFELKIKPKAPKSAKPGKKNEDGPKADFCTLKTNDEDIVKEIFFDVSEFKEVKVKHTIIVEEIVYPEGAASMKPEEVRENSKRKGKVIREIDVDGMKKTSEAEFLA